MFTVTGQGQESTKKMIFGIVTRIDVLNYVTSHTAAPAAAGESRHEEVNGNGLVIRWINGRSAAARLWRNNEGFAASYKLYSALVSVY